MTPSIMQMPTSTTRLIKNSHHHQGKIGAAGGDYYSSYHRIDANLEQIIWNINDTSLIMRNMREPDKKRLL